MNHLRIITLTAFFILSFSNRALSSDLLSDWAIYLTEKIEEGHDKAEQAYSIFGFVALPWSVRPDLALAVTELLETGPNRWIELPHKVPGKYTYQRGLSNGVYEAMNLISGRSSPFNACVSFLADPEFTDTFVQNINAGYSNPLTVRGKIDSFAKTMYYAELESGLDALLRDPKECFGQEFYCRMGNRPGETQELVRGFTIDTVEAFGTFTPPPDSRNPATPKHVFATAARWALSYVDFYETLLRLGIMPREDSRGHAFYSQLKHLVRDLKQSAMFSSGSLISDSLVAERASALYQTFTEYDGNWGLEHLEEVLVEEHCQSEHRL